MDFGVQNPSLMSPNPAAAFHLDNFEDLLSLDCIQSPYHVDQISTDVFLPANTCHQDYLNIGFEGWSDLIPSDPMLPGEEQMPQQYQGNAATTEIPREAAQSKPSEMSAVSVSESNGKGRSHGSKSGEKMKLQQGVQKRKKGVSSCPKQNHKILERERRKCMHDLFMTLHSLLPHSTPSKRLEILRGFRFAKKISRIHSVGIRKANLHKEQSTILDETIKYIPVAETKLEELQSTKKLLLLSSIQEAEDSLSTGSSSLSNEKMSSTTKTVNTSSSTACSSPPNISIKVENGEVNITVSTSDGWGAPLSRMLHELTTYGFVLKNCNVFKSGTMFFQHFNGKYPCAASRPSTEYDIRGILEKVLFSNQIHGIDSVVV